MIPMVAVSSGICISKAIVIEKKTIIDYTKDAHDINKELEKIDYCFKKTKLELESLNKNINEWDISFIFKKYIRLISSPQLKDDIEYNIISKNISAEYSIISTLDNYICLLKTMDSECFATKVEDLEEIKYRLLNKILPKGISRLKYDDITDECVLVVESLTIGDILSMDLNLIKGIVMMSGCQNSSACILARHFEIPLVSGLGYEGAYIKNGDTLLVDGNKGIVFVNPEDKNIKEYCFAM